MLGSPDSDVGGDSRGTDGTGPMGRGGTRLKCRGGDSMTSFELAGPWDEVLLEERNRRQGDFADLGVAGTGEFI